MKVSVFTTSHKGKRSTENIAIARGISRYIYYLLSFSVSVAITDDYYKNLLNFQFGESGIYKLFFIELISRSLGARRDKH